MAAPIQVAMTLPLTCASNFPRSGVMTTIWTELSLLVLAPLVLIVTLGATLLVLHVRQKRVELEISN